MEDTACEICGNQAYTPVVTNTDFFLGGDKAFQIVECTECTVLYQRPRPTAATIGQHYPPEYQPFTPSLRTENWLRRLDRSYGLAKRCKLITRYIPQGQLLDIGCATGDFLSEMQRHRNWQVAGVEPNHLAAQYANENTSGKVVEGTANDVPFESGAFDAVTMWDVIEHVYDPPSVIREISRLLRPGGLLVMNYPNLESLDRQVFGPYWCGYDLPRHLYLFPCNLLRTMMEEHGFVELDRRCLYGSYSAVSTSILFLTRAQFGSGQVVDYLRRIFRSKVLRGLCMPYFKLIDRYTLGSSVTTVYRRS